MTKKAVIFYSNFPFRIGILCLLSFRSQFLLQYDILMCMYSITQHLVCFSLREPIFRSTIEYYFSLTLVLVSLYVNPAQVCSTDSFCRTSSHICACRNTYLQKSFADDSGSCPGVSGVRKADRFGPLATGSKGVLAPRFCDHGLKFGLGVCKNTKWMGENVLHFRVFLFAIPFIIIIFFYSYCIPLIDAHIALNFWLIQMRIIFPFSNCNGQKRTEGILHVLDDLKDDTMYLTADSKRSP